MSARTDLWGEIEVGAIRSPVTILREQAALLGSKTKNLVEARVDTTTGDGGEFSHAFNLMIPALDYTFRLFSVRHGVDLYPVSVMPEARKLADESQFEQWLREKLSSPQTTRIVTNLLSQVA